MSYRPMRKPQADCAATVREIESEQQAFARSMMCPGASRHISGAHKAVLQDEYLKSLPKQPQRPAKPAAETKASTSAMDLEALFSAVEGEIAEREATLAQLRKLGQSGPYEAKLQGEISQRVAELKRINAMISGS